MDHLFAVKDDSFNKTKHFHNKLPPSSSKSSAVFEDVETFDCFFNKKKLNLNHFPTTSTFKLFKNDNKIKNDHNLGNELNCHKSKSSVLVFKTLDQPADHLFSTSIMTKSFNSNNYDNRMKLRTEIDSKRNVRFESIQGCNCCINNYRKQYQQPTDLSVYKFNKKEICDAVQLNDSLNNLESIKSSCKLKDNREQAKQVTKCGKENKELNQIRLNKLVPVYLLVEQQVLNFNREFKFFESKNFIELKCNLNRKKSSGLNLNPILLLLMLFCLISPLNAMTTFLSSGLKTKNQQTTNLNSNHSLNLEKNDNSNRQPIATSSSILTSNTFTSTYASSGTDKNRVVTTSPSKRRSYREPSLIATTSSNQTQSNKNSQLSDLVHLSQLIHQSTQQSHSLPYNFPEISSSNHNRANDLNSKKSNESGIFFTSRSSNSLPILNKPVANLTNSHPTTHSRIVITRNQLSKAESKNQPKFKQLDASTILSDLNAQASISSNSVNKNNQENDNQKDEKFTSLNKSLLDNKVENMRRTAQLEANLPETFYQQTKKRMSTVTGNNPSALAQTRNLVLSNILKDAVRPPSVSYSSSVSSSSPKSIINNSNVNNNNANKKQFTRITPNTAQLSSYSVSTSYSTNTSPTPIKRPLASSSTNKDTVVTKDAIITKDLLKDQSKNTPTPDSVYVVHHHHLVSGNTGNQNQNNNNERQQQQSVNRYTLISSTEPSSKSKNYYKTNYYKNEEEDDRVSTSSIFFDDEPSNLDKSNTLDLSMLLKKEYDEQSNNKIPREQLNSQYGTSNLNLFALLPTATTVTITPLTNTQSPVAYHDQTLLKDASSSFKDPSVFSTTVRSIKVDLNRQNNSVSSNTNSRTKPATITKVFGQRESLSDIWRTTNGHSRVPHPNLNNNKEILNNLTNTNVVDMKQFQLNLAKSATRENPKDRSKNLSVIDLNNNKNNTISTFTTQQPILSTTSSAKNHPDKQNPFKYINKNQLDDNKLMDNVLNSIDTNNLPNGLDALDSNQIYNRTMLMNDLKEYKERNLKKSANHSTSSPNDQSNDVLIRPVNEENDELLNNALAGADSPSSRESYRLTTERLAYILIGSACAISIFCLIIVAFSIRCRDMCDEYKQWKNAEKLALFNYRYQQHQQQQQRNHRLKLHQMAAFGGLVSESNSSSSQLISGSSGNAAVGALTNLSRPIFGPSCCCCPTTGATNLNNNNNEDKKHNAKPNSNDQANCPRGYFHNPCLIRGRLPFGAASSIARFTALNPLSNNPTQLNNDNNENSLELLDEENDTLNGSLTDEFTTKIKGTPHPTGVRNNVQPSTSNPQGICLQCTCDDSFDDEESDLGSLSQVPTAIKNSSSNQQQYLRPNQLINATHAKHFNSSTSNVNNHRHHHHLNNHHNNLNNNNNQNKHNNKRNVFQPMESNWIQSSIVDELNRKHNHRLINGNQAKYEDYLRDQFCSIYSVPLTIFSTNCDRLI